MGNETTFLKESIFSEEKKWLRQANLKESKILFAFSWVNEKGDSFENDKLISLVATGVKETFPKLRIMLVLMSKFKE
jgi:predicted XRE-type DNA-binding protein